MQFKKIPDQQEVKEKLIKSVSDNRVSHAQLFLGNSGSGTLPLAIAYAQYLCCTQKESSDSCGTCRSCIKYEKLVHPDLHFAYPMLVNKEKNILTSKDIISTWREAVLTNPYLSLNEWFDYLGVENQQPIIAEAESRDILSKLSLTTYEAEYKVMIIWMAEKMNPVTANKLLKILEEPPDKTLFILVCENEEALLRTLVSRTQLVKVKRIEERFEDETSLNFFQLWMRACLKPDMQKINSLLAEFNDLGREGQKTFFVYSLHLVRECLMINYADASLVQVTEKERDFLKKFSPFINSQNCIPFTGELNKAFRDIERNANPKILFLDLSFIFNELLKRKEPSLVK